MMGTRFRAALPLLTLLAAIGALAQASRAAADQYGLCLQQCGLLPECTGGAGGDCASARSVCESNCTLASMRGGSGGGARGPAVKALIHGAIVYDAATGRSGRAWGDDNGQTAFKRAQQRCKAAGGRTCDITVPIQDGCAVVASGDRGYGLTGYQKSGGHEALPDAISKAIAECRRLQGQNCQITAQVCSWWPRESDAQ